MDGLRVVDATAPQAGATDVARARMATWSRRLPLVLGGALLVTMVITVVRNVHRGDVNFVVFAGSASLLALLAGSRLTVAGRALRDANARLASEHLQLERMFVDARIGMALADSRRRWVRVNPALCEMLGYSEDELVQRDPVELTHPDDLDATRHRFEELDDLEDSGMELEKRYIARDGSVIWAQVSVSATHDRQTGERFLVVQIQDISERKRAEAAYADERHLVQEFLQNIPEQVYFKDLESRFLRVSQLQASRLGYDRAEDLIGKTDFDVFSDGHARQAFADEQRIIATGEPILDLEECETFPGDPRGPDAGAETAWVLTSKLPLRDAQGEIVGTFGISRDITQRKRSEAAAREGEERWRTLLAHLQEIAVLVDADSRFTYATPSIERWLGYGPDELVGTDLSTIGHPEDHEAMGHALATVSPAEPVSVTHRVQHRDGSWHTLQSTLVCLRDDPVVQSVLIASRDVTDRLALDEERERLDLERRVSHRLEAVGQLAAGIAHEINTPLQFVGDSVTFLKDAVEELLILTGRYRELLWLDTALSVSQRREIMTAAEEEADVEYLLERIPAAFDRTGDGVARVRSIVQAMKRFSHASNTEAAAADLNEAIETTLAVCRNEYKYVADISLELGSLPPVTCNIGELNQVFLNLIINAAQAIEEQVGDEGARGEIRISTLVQDDQAVVRIADTGPGIPPELRERIYEPFFTTKEVGKGTGQGLALARTAVERHSGSIECDSAPGAGTTFTIRLPLTSPAAGVAKAA